MFFRAVSVLRRIAETCGDCHFSTAGPGAPLEAVHEAQARPAPDLH